MTLIEWFVNYIKYNDCMYDDNLRDYNCDKSLWFTRLAYIFWSLILRSSTAHP